MDIKVKTSFNDNSGGSPPHSPDDYRPQSPDIQQFIHGISDTKNSLDAVTHSMACTTSLTHLETIFRQLRRSKPVKAVTKVFVAMSILKDLSHICDDHTQAAVMIAHHLLPADCDQTKGESEYEISPRWIGYYILSHLSLTGQEAIETFNSCCREAGNPDLSVDQAVENLKAARLVALFLGWSEADILQKLYASADGHPKLGKIVRCYRYGKYHPRMNSQDLVEHASEQSTQRDV
jgi:hypothetical protein